MDILACTHSRLHSNPCTCIDSQQTLCMCLWMCPHTYTITYPLNEKWNTASIAAAEVLLPHWRISSSLSFRLIPHVAVPRAVIPITEQSPSLAAFTVYQHCSTWSTTCKIQCPFSETSIELQESCTWLANHETSTILEPHTKNYDNIPFPVVDCSSA